MCRGRSAAAARRPAGAARAPRRATQARHARGAVARSAPAGRRPRLRRLRRACWPTSRWPASRWASSAAARRSARAVRCCSASSAGSRPPGCPVVPACGWSCSPLAAERSRPAVAQPGRRPACRATRRRARRALPTGRRRRHPGRRRRGAQPRRAARRRPGRARRLHAAARAIATPPLEGLARHVEPRYGWDDIVLPADGLAQLRELCARLRHQGTVLERWGYGRKHARRRGIDRPVRRAARHRQDHGRRDRRRRAGAGPVPHRPVGGGQQVHRRDREEPRTHLPRRRPGRRRAAVRRGRRALRQALRSARRARPLRQRRDRLPAAAARDVRRPGRAGHQPARQHRRGVHAPAGLRRGVSAARRGRAAADLAAGAAAEAPLGDDVDLPFLARKFKLAGGHIRNIALAAAFLAAEDRVPIGMGTSRAPPAASTRNWASWLPNRISSSTTACSRTTLPLCEESLQSDRTQLRISGTPGRAAPQGRRRRRA